jgi:hypothetical protein
MSENTAPARQGLIQSLWGVIVRPRATLAHLSAHGARSWWLPALLVVVLTAAPLVVSAPITARQARESILEAQDQMAEQRGQTLTDEQREQIVSIGASPLITTVFPTVGAIVGLVVSWLAWAGGLYLAGMALGGRSAFGTLFRTMVWTQVPFALRGLVQTIYVLVTGQVILNPGLSGFVGRDLGAEGVVAAPPGLGQLALQGLLARVDLYMIWNLVLLVIGVRVVTQLSRRKALLMTLVVWLLLTVLSLAPAIVGGLFSRQLGGF